MRYIRKYNESKGYSLKEILTNIKYMLLDFEDDGFGVKVEAKSIDRFDNMISISIDTEIITNCILSADKVLTFTDRLKSYFDMEGIKYDIQYQWHDDRGIFKETSLDELELPSGEIQNIWIEIFIEK